MVKPPKSMQPGGIGIGIGIERDDVRNPHRGMGNDSFRHYMARKIELQRKQFGCLEPPPKPTLPRKRVQFEVDGEACTEIGKVVQRLKRRHRQKKQKVQSVRPYLQKKDRKDLFFRGVVVIVNGYTNPDNETLMRMLHKHGGDLEKYETLRVTHVIAEHLSTAKANIYRQQRKHLPVVHPKWIVDSCHAQELLPHGRYLIDEVKLRRVKTINSSFQNRRRMNFAECINDDHKWPALSKDLAKVDRDLDRYHRHLKQRREGNCEFAKLRIQSGNSHETSSAPNSRVCEYWHQVSPKRSQNLQTESKNHDTKRATEASYSARVPIDLSTGTSEEIVQTKHHDDPDWKHPEGRMRTVGTDPNFLQSFFSASRLRYIGSYRQRLKPALPAGQSAAKPDFQRFVLHVDMDCFFASVVLRNYPQFKNKPVAISHHGGRGLHQVPFRSTSECATCNYEARKFGVKKGMFLGRARELCPNLIVLKYDFQGYEEVSDQVSEILHSSASPHGCVEQVSCDEFYVEKYLPKAEMVDQHIFEIASSIREQIFTQTRCTATVGVGANKLLAKIATSSVKPDGCKVLTDFKGTLKGLRLRGLHGVGYRTEAKLRKVNLITVKDVWDLGQQAEGVLSNILGQNLGKKILLACQGEDDRPVQPAPRKTIGAECNYGVRFDGPYGPDHMISELAKELQRRMQSEAVKGKRVTLKVKEKKEGAPSPPKFLGHGACHNHSRSMELPGGLATWSWDSLYSAGRTLFGEFGVAKDDVRGMGLIVSNLSEVSSSTDSTKGELRKWFREVETADGGHGKVNSSPPRGAQSEQKGTETSVKFPIPQQEDSASPRSGQLEIPTLETRNQRSSNQERNEEHGPLQVLSNDDIALPSFSQLHLSQVEMLPEGLRFSIFSKVQRHYKCAFYGGNSSTAPINPKDRMRQTTLRGLLGPINETMTTRESECNPLRVRRQVTDDASIAKRHNPPSGVCKRQPTRAATLGKTQEFLFTGVCNGVPPSESDCGRNADYKTPNRKDLQMKNIECIRRKSFYHDNILPLRHFMDQQDSVDESSVRIVREFLGICLQEHRISDFVKILRSIKGRQDEWGQICWGDCPSSSSFRSDGLTGSKLDGV